ncbi:MAG: imidazoleglycerol-phosphate dehydratase HisB [Candidatus Riflemargulisbacteria bacterium]
MITRKSSLSRNTKETQISVDWNLDGKGTYSNKTSVPFLNHMLDLFAKHGYFDLTVVATGDIEVDHHHLVEDLGIVMGQVFKTALGDKKGIKRFGFFILPMDESLATVAIDISNRPYLNFDVNFGEQLQAFDHALIKEFFSAFVTNAGITLHIKVPYGDNSHHIIEAIFKCFAKTLDIAISSEGRETGIPSTKGII